MEPLSAAVILHDYNIKHARRNGEMDLAELKISEIMMIYYRKRNLKMQMDCHLNQEIDGENWKCRN